MYFVGIYKTSNSGNIIRYFDKINTLLNKTNAAFRVTEENIDETLSNMLPIIILDGTILTAFGVPTLNDVIVEVENNL